MRMNRIPYRRPWGWLCLVVALLALSSCGSGGGGESPDNSDWDAMRWEEGTWQ